MYLLAEFGRNRSYGNGDINSYINSYMNTLKKAKINALVQHIEKFSKSGILIYNSKVLDTAGRKTRRRRRRTQSFARCHTFHANAISNTVYYYIQLCEYYLSRQMFEFR